MKFFAIFAVFLVEVLASKKDDIEAVCDDASQYQHDEGLLDRFVNKGSLIVSIEDNACFSERITQEDDKYQFMINFRGSPPEILNGNFSFRSQDNSNLELEPNAGDQQYLFATSEDYTIYTVQCISPDDGGGVRNVWIIGVVTDECSLECARNFTKRDGFEYDEGICDQPAKDSGMIPN